MRYLTMLLFVLVPKYGLALDCEQAYTTMEINQCERQTLDEAENKMQQYLEKSLAKFSNDAVTRKSIERAQTVWLNYREAHCNSVFDQWRGGSVRIAMTVACETELTEQRTKVLWSSFLTFVDSSQPILPEP